ncbi:MAG: bacillithiol system redox-active protein YtxJ [Chitinophagales bacterium]|jgi:bacillithiol system protein YtxJ|nr:bacillithiol system redox-active protein YtxJ [Bacteroidota bacterium]MBK9556044.1 bacillithiol system redox-active protein YtxJ [Bacteroidota bacterium]MBL0279184.1 bacillithiol system redox-active protein YtxJ [Bacteroidota bacterium]MBP8249009.1 bacillithiol system redox-active protein YtxJ [Chitinophagales bacterium]MBP9878887.1 bacillithiol system redox-active protein YtxJ [Chitinophagales bacterium]
MNWIELGTEQELLKLTEKSFTQPQAIFKHSTTCGTSFHVKMMLEDEVTPENIDFHYLDLLANRPLSNKIATQFNVHHESPQILIIKDGKCVYHTSHLAIRMEKISQFAKPELSL